MRRSAPRLLALGLTAALAACGGSQTKGEDQNFRVADGSQPPSGEQRVPGQGSLTAYVARGTALRDRPNGRALATLRVKTEFGSPRVLTVVQRRPGWLGVYASELPNHRVGWIPERGVDLFRVNYAIDVDLSRRQLVASHGRQVVARVPVAIGKPSAPTPLGVYAVSDRLYTRNDSPYGCCVLALTGHQPRVPQEWGGGDRLAIHATLDPASIGKPISLGCLRADTFQMRKLMKMIPLGTRVSVRA